MNTEEAVQYIKKIKDTVMKQGFPFKYSEFCLNHEPVGIVFKKHNMFNLFPILQEKDTHNVILYMNQNGRHITTKGKEGLPIYRFFGCLEPIV
jgi:hypothetical protein